MPYKKTGTNLLSFDFILKRLSPSEVMNAAYFNIVSETCTWLLHNSRELLKLILYLCYLQESHNITVILEQYISII